jgi:hypothetical protein
MKGRLLNNQLERILKQTVVANQGTLPVVFLMGLRKSTNNLSQDGWFPAEI